MKAEVYDFDNALYRDPPNKNDIFLLAAIEAAQELRPDLNIEVIEEAAKRSYPQYGTDFAVFVKEFQVDEALIHPLYHSLARHEIFDQIDPDPNIIEHFEGRVSAKIPFCIVSHGSLEWLKHGLKKMGLSEFFQREFLLAADTDAIAFNYKNVSLYPLRVAAKRLGVNMSELRLFDDSRSNLRIASSGGVETVLVHWGHDLPRPDDFDYIKCKVCKVSDYTI